MVSKDTDDQNDHDEKLSAIKSYLAIKVIQP